MLERIAYEPRMRRCFRKLKGGGDPYLGRRSLMRVSTGGFWSGAELGDTA